MYAVLMLSVKCTKQQEKKMKNSETDKNTEYRLPLRKLCEMDDKY